MGVLGDIKLIIWKQWMVFSFRNSTDFQDCHLQGLALLACVADKTCTNPVVQTPNQRNTITTFSHCLISVARKVIRDITEELIYIKLLMFTDVETY